MSCSVHRDWREVAPSLCWSSGSQHRAGGGSVSLLPTFSHGSVGPSRCNLATSGSLQGVGLAAGWGSPRLPRPPAASCPRLSLAPAAGVIDGPWELLPARWSLSAVWDGPRCSTLGFTGPSPPSTPCSTLRGVPRGAPRTGQGAGSCLLAMKESPEPPWSCLVLGNDLQQNRDDLAASSWPSLSRAGDGHIPSHPLDPTANTQSPDGSRASRLGERQRLRADNSGDSVSWAAQHVAAGSSLPRASGIQPTAPRCLCPVCPPRGWWLPLLGQLALLSPRRRRWGRRGGSQSAPVAALAPGSHPGSVRAPPLGRALAWCLEGWDGSLLYPGRPPAPFRGVTTSGDPPALNRA